jgi:hypothetical protein
VQGPHINSQPYPRSSSSCCDDLALQPWCCQCLGGVPLCSPLRGWPTPAPSAALRSMVDTHCLFCASPFLPHRRSRWGATPWLAPLQCASPCCTQPPDSGRTAATCPERVVTCLPSMLPKDLLTACRLAAQQSTTTGWSCGSSGACPPAPELSPYKTLVLSYPIDFNV